MLQSEALNILKTGASVFLTGEPGSGKTYVTNAFVRYLKRAKVEVAVTASTGIAATHLGGMTIHSWSGIGISKTLSPWDIDRIASNERIAKRITKTSVLVIDEISMLDGKTLQCVDQVCREVRRNDEPFGGIQTVFVGDFFQLPPVSRLGEPLPEFAFASSTWAASNPFICYLSEQYRQEDGLFLELLSSLRKNQVLDSHKAELDKRCLGNAVSLSSETPKLYSHNVDVDRLNAEELGRILQTSQHFEMVSSGKAPLVEQLKRGCLSPEQLVLKKGASVMFTKNSSTGAFVNGTLGIVVDFDETTNYPIVKTRSGKSVTTEPMEWSMEEQGRVVARIMQIPLRLAWAMTIHKSQGMSLDAAFIDLKHAFVQGQGYVALSRVRTLAGVYLSGWNSMALQVHPEVLAVDIGFHERSNETREAFGKILVGELTTMHENYLHACGGIIPKDGADEPTAVKKYSVDTIRKKHKNAYKSWSEEDDEQLTELHTAGNDVDEISSAMGRQKGGIRARLVKLGLVTE